MTITLYNMDNKKKASDWVKKEVKGKTTYDAPQLSSGCIVSHTGEGKLLKDAFGVIVNKSNSVYQNASGVVILSSSFSDTGSGAFSIIPDNFFKVVALFSARRCITKNWLNDKFEYMEPTIKGELHENK